MLIDAHAHLTGEENPDIANLLKRAQEACLEAIINVCCSLDDLQRGLVLASSSQNPQVCTIAAITPHDAAKEDQEPFFAYISRCAGEGKLFAIGETGLDYYYEHAPRDKQQALLRQFYRLACQMKLPIVIHCRDAFADLFAILDEESARCKESPDVMLHCFTGSLQEAQEAIARGWYISLSGCVTYPKNSELQRVAASIPLEQLLLETDSPYLAPQGFRGKKNEPAFLRQTAQYVAGYRGICFDDLAHATAQNTKRFFKIKSG